MEDDMPAGARPRPAAPDPAAVHPDLPEVIRQFRDRSWQLHDPLFAHDRAEPFATAFAAACQDRGIPAAVITGMQTTGNPRIPGSTLILRGNFAVLVPAPPDAEEHAPDPGDGIVIEWTARQYNPRAPVPAITSAAAWRREWPGLGADQAAAPPRPPAPGTRTRPRKPPGTQQEPGRPRRQP